METVDGRPLTPVCETWRHPLGWELQVLGHALQTSSVIRSGEAMIQTIEEWRRAMLDKGWSDMSDPGTEPAIS